MTGEVMVTVFRSIIELIIYEIMHNSDNDDDNTVKPQPFALETNEKLMYVIKKAEIILFHVKNESNVCCADINQNHYNYNYNSMYFYLNGFAVLYINRI